MMNKTLFAAALVLALPPLASATDLSLPKGSILAAEKNEGYTSQRLPIGPFALGEIPAIWAEGTRLQKAWQTSADSGLTTLQVLAPLRQQLVEQGYEILFECRDKDCGGFDFRFAQDLLPEPEMHVNLGDYRYLSAQRMTEDQPEYVALMVSRNRSRGFVQVTSIGADRAPELVSTVTATMNDPQETLTIATDSGIGQKLEEDGVAVLGDLDFEVGSSKLAKGEFPSLAELADFLNHSPERTVSLVGHTDTVGSIDANFRLSKARAASVRERLINGFGVSPAQLDAQGVGYLAPLASNLSETGRSLNRRVEVVLTSVN